MAAGSNLPGGFATSIALLDAALLHFPQAGLPVLSSSSWWRSAAWPDPFGPEYRNGVIIVERVGDPRAMLLKLLDLERAFGRQRGAANAARTLDLDLIAFGRQVVDEPGLTVPHPRAHERLFVMGPLAEIAPGWRHPVLGSTAAELARTATVGRDATPLA